MLSRNFTNPFNWILDNIIPPFLRDYKYFMGPMLRIVIGKKYKEYMRFKESFPQMNDESIAQIYVSLSDTFISRDTDLNQGSIQFILDEIIGENVLDAGCGRGFLAKKIFAEKGIKVSGIDFLADTITVENKNTIFVKGNIQDMPFDDDTFDTVICAHTLEHVKNIQQALVELRRVASKKLILIVPRQREYKYTFDLHVHFFPYIHTFKRIVNNPEGKCIIIHNDIVYTENL